LTRSSWFASIQEDRQTGIPCHGPHDFSVEGQRFDQGDRLHDEQQAARGGRFHDLTFHEICSVGIPPELELFLEIMSSTVWQGHPQRDEDENRHPFRRF
jgi:hypothetical protein